MTNTASCAVDDAEQVALIAAQVGTAAGLGRVMGLGEVSGERFGDGVRVGLVAREGDGLGREAEVPEPHPTSASSAARANTPSLTGS